MSKQRTFALNPGEPIDPSNCSHYIRLVYSMHQCDPIRSLRIPASIPQVSINCLLADERNDERKGVSMCVPLFKAPIREYGRK